MQHTVKIMNNVTREVALQLAGLGASVAVNDLDEGPANEVIDTIKGRGCAAVA